MKSLFFDAGPIISLTTNNLLWTLRDMKRFFNGNFCFVPAVKREVIDNPFSSKQFKFEALQVQMLLSEGIFTLVENQDILDLSEELSDLANNCFLIDGTYLQIVHPGEMQTIAAALLTGSSAVVIDERTTRVLMEDPRSLVDILEHRLQKKIKTNADSINEFVRRTKELKVLRSVELIVLAYEKGLLNKFLPISKDPKGDLLSAVLWGLKLHGCAISEREIEEIVKLEKKEA